jgi:uncharacterized delta-60 repeat protein
VTTDNFYLFDTIGAEKVVGTQTVSANSIILTPTAVLSKNTVYEGTITHELLDEGGTGLEGTYTWTFRTIAAVGELDTNFGNDGIVRKEFSTETDQIGAVHVLENDKILVAGNMFDGSDHDGFVARFDQNGTLDPSFGSGGVRLFPTISTASNEYFTCLDVQSDGSIIAGGVMTASSNPDFFIARFTKDGSVDNTFGSGDAHFLLHLGDDSIDDISIASSDTIFASGHDSGDGNGVVLAVKPDGSGLDTGFNGESAKLIQIATYYPKLPGIVHQNDGTIISAGNVYYTSEAQEVLCLLKLSATGGLDSAFGASGISLTKIGENDTSVDCLIQPDGKIVVVGFTENSGGKLLPFAARFLSDGLLDTGSFGTNGVVVLEFGADVKFNSVKLQDNGKIIIGGHTAGGATGADPLFVRLMPDGSLDAKFGPSSEGYISFSASTKDEVIFSIDTQSTGRVIGGGYLIPSSGTHRDSFIVGVW